MLKEINNNPKEENSNEENFVNFKFSGWQKKISVLFKIAMPLL
jgi:hypothetical protein